MAIDNLYSNFNPKGDTSTLKNLYDNIPKNDNVIDDTKDNIYQEKVKVSDDKISGDTIDTTTVIVPKITNLGKVY